ncbi:MAG: hypothetical protein HY235_03975, partial [Acidobacteria bacterium]|nr:hypothetical protein [Acidobacteriota bacterium]
MLKTSPLLLLPALAFSGELFRDDFSRYPPGVLSAPIGQLNGAIQEYHYIAHRAEAWEGITYSYLEQHIVVTDARYHPLFVTGDPEWSDYTVEARVRPLKREEIAGIVFRYRTSR